MKPQLPQYDTPDWSAPAPHPWTFETIKGGMLLEKFTVASTKAYLTLGKLESNDIQLEHPSISRLHAVLQFSATSDAFVYDCGSTHGVFVNTVRLSPREFVQLHDGDQMRFGASSRTMVATNAFARAIDDDDDEKDNGNKVIDHNEAQLRLSPPKVKENKAQQEQQEQPKHKKDINTDDDDDDDCDYASGEKALLPNIENDNDIEQRNGALVPLPAHITRDPRKALTAWLEARGEKLVFEVRQVSDEANAIIASLCIKDVDAAGSAVTVVSEGRGVRRAEAEAMAITDALEQLHARGMLLDEYDKSAAQKKRLWNILDQLDDEEERNYCFDQTKKSADAKVAKITKLNTVENAESLWKKRQRIVAGISAIENSCGSVSEVNGKTDKKALSRNSDDGANDDDDEDELDKYMSELASHERRAQDAQKQKQIKELETELYEIDSMLRAIGEVPPSGRREKIIK